jgi:hypothetical protein
MILQYIKNKIDEMNYAEMLSKWRFSPSGNPMFEGETGDYFRQSMNEKKEKLAPGEHVAISKAIGW